MKQEQQNLEGGNNHELAEGVIKGVGKSLDKGVSEKPRKKGDESKKGSL